VEDLDAILGDLACYRAAEHGWEERLPDGRRLAHPIPAGAARALDAAAARAGILFPADRLERKRASIVLHTRGLPPAEARASERAARRAWRPLLRRAPLRLDAASGGLELRARGRDKGTVVRALLRPLPADTLPVCVGDDPSDEDAFAAVARRGVAIRVGREVRRSRARARLDSPRAVVGFLDRWLAIPSAAPAIRRAAR
jgi:trehalose-phosphatase